MDDKEYKEFMGGDQWTPEQQMILSSKYNKDVNQTEVYTMACGKKHKRTGGNGKKGK